MAASVPDGPGPSTDFALRATAQRRREAPTLTDLTRPAKARHEGVMKFTIKLQKPIALVGTPPPWLKLLRVLESGLRLLR